MSTIYFGKTIESARKFAELKGDKMPHMETREEIAHELRVANGYGTEGSPREWTDEEVCERFVKAALAIASDWSGYEDHAPEDRCRGVVFSMLAMLDGSNATMPSFNLVPDPHPEDKEFFIRDKCNYYVARPANKHISLHDLMIDIEVEQNRK